MSVITGEGTFSSPYGSLREGSQHSDRINPERNNPVAYQSRSDEMCMVHWIPGRDPLRRGAAGMLIVRASIQIGAYASG